MLSSVFVKFAYCSLGPSSGGSDARFCMHAWHLRECGHTVVLNLKQPAHGRDFIFSSQAKCVATAT